MKVLQFRSYLETLCLKRKLQFHTFAEAYEFLLLVENTTMMHEFTYDREKAPLCFYMNGPLTFNQCRFLASRAGRLHEFMRLANPEVLKPEDPVKVLQQLEIL